MSVFDDKTKNVIESNGRFILPSFPECDEAIFKASYVVASDLICNGKVTALFDLTVLGNVEASELDVKGKFICIGKCVISDNLVVQYDIWADDLRAEVIDCRDRIVAHEIDSSIVRADGNIIVGKCLAVEKLAQSGNSIICGETAYGAGKVAANIVVTGEPIDLDDGTDAVVNPNVYCPSSSAIPVVELTDMAPINTLPDFSSNGNWSGYLDWLIESSVVASEKERFLAWKATLSQVDGIIRVGIENCRDLMLLIWTAGIALSDYFDGWTQVKELYNAIDRHFATVVINDRAGLLCPIGSYRELLQALDILNQYGDFMDRTAYGVAFEMLISYFGLKSKFLSERLNEKGWNTNG